MIARIWHGWTTSANAQAYQALLTGKIMPEIEARGIAGYLGYEMLRQDRETDVEFITIMRFASEADIVRFAGADVTKANLPEAALKLLCRWDERSMHYHVEKPL